VLAQSGFAGRVDFCMRVEGDFHQLLSIETVRSAITVLTRCGGKRPQRQFLQRREDVNFKLKPVGFGPVRQSVSSNSTAAVSFMSYLGQVRSAHFEANSPTALLCKECLAVWKGSHYRLCTVLFLIFLLLFQVSSTKPTPIQYQFVWRVIVSRVE